MGVIEYMRFNNILINVTERCDVGCRHCGYIGAKRDREMTAIEMESWVGQVCGYGISKIIFTGGEPFGRQDLLARGVQCAHNCGVLTSVFTSAFWAASPEQARSTLRNVPGLDQLYISTDRYHQERVPLASVYNAIDAAIAAGVSRITLVITYDEEPERDAVAAQYSRYGDRVEVSWQRLILNKTMQRAGKEPAGGLGLAPDGYECGCFLGTPLINPDGNVFSCHIGKAAAHRDIRNMPYFLGNLREAAFIDIMSRALHRSDYRFLLAHGPKGVAEMVQAHPEIAQDLPRRQFASGCDMCMSIMLMPSAAKALQRHAEASTDATEIRLALSAVKGTLGGKPRG